MRIRWTEPAAQDFTRICDYIEEHGPTHTGGGLPLVSNGKTFGKIATIPVNLEIATGVVHPHKEVL